MRRHVLHAALAALVLTAGCADDTEEPDSGPAVLAEEVMPGIVVQTTRTAEGDAVSTLIDEVRVEVLANARFTAADLTWYGAVIVPMARDHTDVLHEEPGLAELNAMLVTVWRDVVSDAAAGLAAYDAPGCTSIPDLTENNCRQNCCAEHDRCYYYGGCTSASWDPAWGEGWDCFMCNWEVAKCWGECTLDPPPCEETQCGCGKSSCFDVECPEGRAAPPGTQGNDFYCASDCNNGGASPCDNPPDDYPQDACVYADGATRLSMHGGAVVACVPWCENLGLGKASGWWWSETLFCCVCERAGGYNPRDTWPWLTKPWPYPIPEIHYRGDGHPGSPFGPCEWYPPGGYWICG
jgi:hypothetical protein